MKGTNIAPSSSKAMLEKNTDLCGAISELISWSRQQNYSFITPSPATHARVVSRSRAGPSRSVRDAFGWSLPFQADLLPEALLESLHRADLIHRSAIIDDEVKDVVVVDHAGLVSDTVAVPIQIGLNEAHPFRIC